MIAVSDSKGGIYCKDGIHAEKAVECKEETGAIQLCTTGKVNYKVSKGATCKNVTNKELLEIPCDLFGAFGNGKSSYKRQCGKN